MPVYFEYWKKIGNISEDKKFLDLTDTPYSYIGKGHQILRINTSETGVECYPLDAAVNFIELRDVPISYSGNKGRIVRVNAEEDGLEYTELPPPGATTFLQLADVPSNYDGAYKSLRTNSSNNKLEFVKDIRKFIDLEDLYPKSFVGKAGKTVIVNDSENGVTFSYETDGIPLLVVKKKTDLPVIDVSGGRIAVTKDEYFNLYIFNLTQLKWKVLSGTNSYLNQAAFPTVTGAFIIDEGTKIYDVTEKVWMARKNNAWVLSGDGSGTGTGEIASTTTLGVIKVGSRLSIDTTGILTAQLQSDNNFTNTYKTKLDGIESQANKYIHPTYHSADLIVETAAKRFVSNDQIIRWENASGYAMPMASDILLGGVKVGLGLSINPSGVLSVTKPLNPASITNMGGIKIGSRVSVTDEGILSATVQSDENFTTELKDKLVSISPQAIQAASTTLLGGIIVGQRLSVTPEGTLSAVIQSDINFTGSYRDKLLSIEAGANYYVHPTTHAASMVIQDGTHRFVTDVEKAKWNAGGYVEWANVLSKPTEFKPEQHFHNLKDLLDAPPNYIPNMVLKVNEFGTGYVFAEYNGGSGTNAWKSGPGAPAIWEETNGTFTFDKFINKTNNVSIKYIIPSTELKSGGIGVKLLFGAYGYNEYTIKKCFIGTRDRNGANPYTVSGEFTQVTFNNGDVGITVYNDYGVYSDYIDYTLDETDDLVISLFCIGKIPGNQLLGRCRYFSIDTQDYSSVVAPSGMTENNDMTMALIRSVYVRTGDFVIDDAYYLDFSNGDVWNRIENTTWKQIGNILGPLGKPGRDGAFTFLELTDAPDEYTTKQNKLIVVNSTADGLTFVDQYIHPTTHPASMIVQDVSHRFVTDSQINTWNNIATNFGVPATYTTLGSVRIGTRLTVQTDGTLSSDKQTDENFTTALKEKLLAIEPLATHYVHPSTHLASIIVTDSLRRFVTDDQIVQWNSSTASTFTGLTDTPPAYADNATKLVAVKTDATGLEFVDKALISGARKFIELTDAPNSLTLQTGKAIVVNETSDGLTFASLYTHPTTHPATIIVDDAFHRWMTDAEKLKLTNIQENANYFVYTHPTNHPASIITQDSNNRFVTDSQITQWNAGSVLPISSSSILGGVIIGSGLTVQADGRISVTVTTDNNFTNTYKTKLDGLINYTHPISHDAAIIIQDSSHRFVSDSQITLWTSGSAYTLPEATASILGGIKVGSRLSIAGGILSATIQTDNNFTNTYKTKVDSLYNYTHPSTHPANIIIQDSDNRFVTDAQISTWNLGSSSYSLPEASALTLGGIKVGSGLSINSGTLSVTILTDNNFTNTYKTKLDGLINYTHPVNHPANIITQDSNNRFVTDAQINSWNSSNNSYILPEATDAVLGGILVGSGLTISGGILSVQLQSSNDFNNTYKSKLDSIEAGANNYTHPASHPASILTQDDTHRLVSDVQISTWTNKPNNFINLLDVQNTYTGNAGKSVIVNPTETGLIFSTSSGQQFNKFTFISSTKTVQHNIQHNLNSMYLMWNILVEDPFTNEWANDDVSIKIIDNNNIRIQLTEACNIKIAIIKID